MLLPELVRRSAEKMLADYCRKWTSPPESPSRLGYSLRGTVATLFEETTATAGGLLARPVARFIFAPEINQWTLHYHDRERGWRFYLNIGPTLDVGRLLRHLDEDPTRTFWD